MRDSKIIQFFEKESKPDELRRVLVTAVLSGLSSVALIAIINKTSNGDETRTRFLFLYFLALVGFYLANRYLLVNVTIIVERQVRQLRLRITDKIRQCELSRLERLGKGQMHVVLSQETALVSESAATLINCLQQGIMGLFCLGYIAYLSKAAFMIVIGAIIITVLLFSRLRVILAANFARLAEKDKEMFDGLDHILDGFKEVRLNWNKNQAIYSSFESDVLESEDLKVKNGEHFAVAQMSTQMFLYGLLAVIIFIMPEMIDDYEDLVSKMVSSVLFLIGPLIVVISSVPVVVRMNTALENLSTLEDKLKVELETARADRGRAMEDFKKVEFQSVQFSYLDDAGLPSFSVGPLDFEVEKGKLTFVTGGNGSGKSTLLKLLTGLYLPDGGAIRVNGKMINHSNASLLREQYGVIFTDFHLFDRFYGLEDVDPERVEDLIQKMELQNKVHYQDGRFSTIQLSTGQRKRLALIIALLEDRNIYIFDEWAADQDIHFRKIFYNEIIPELLSRGRTVVAVTHDDRFWPLADTLIKVSLGQITEIKKKSPKTEGEK